MRQWITRRDVASTGFGLLLTLIFIYLFVLQLRAIWPFTIDDMYISLRYAKNWYEGFGLLWNIGELPVEGYSNFSFVLLGRLALMLGYDPVLILKSAGVVGLFFTCLAIYAITRMWFVAGIAVIPCVWLLSYKGQILWSISGLETTVYEALICGAVFFIFRGLGYRSFSGAGLLSQSSVRPYFFLIAGLLLALAGMTRPEAPVLMAVFIVLLVINKSKFAAPAYWKSWLLFCFTIVLCFAPYFFWRWHFFGRMFPNPVYCKGLSHPMTYTLDKSYLQFIWPFALLAIPALWKGKDPRYYFLLLPSLVYLILLFGADPIVAFDNRLFLPAFVLLLPLSLQGMSILLTRCFQLNGPDYLSMYLGAVWLTFFFIPMMTLGSYRYFTVNPMAGQALRVNVLFWLRSHVPEGSRVVLADSGLIPYQSDLKFIDSYCLNNVKMTRYSKETMYQQFCEDVFQTKPEVIILTALIEEGKTTYTPADACLVKRLRHTNDYCQEFSVGSGDHHSNYRYEIYNKRNNTCSKMQSG